MKSLANQFETLTSLLAINSTYIIFKINAPLNINDPVAFVYDQ